MYYLIVEIENKIRYNITKLYNYECESCHLKRAPEFTVKCIGKMYSIGG
ncbi:hypothetical protein [Terrisporobacter petrolearius]